MSIAQNLTTIKARMREACDRADRDPAEVQLIAVSKTKPAAEVELAAEAGQFHFGENRVQEALAKMDEVTSEVHWHLIGPLQRNKVPHVLGRFHRIHAVDSVRLANRLQMRLAKENLKQKVLVQVNLSEEPTKAGLHRGEVDGFFDQVADWPAVEVVGLMTIPPPVDDPEAQRPAFRQVRELRDSLQDRLGLALPELSMGMSDDFTVAIEEGATWVRIGTAIFGAREK